MFLWNSVMKTIATIFVSIDIGLYTFLSLLIQGYLSIATYADELLGGTSMFIAMSKRLYVLIGVFALFKLAVNLLNAVISPEKLTDKENGFTKLIPRAVISLVLFMLLPSIFKMAFGIQRVALVSIPQIILGTSSDDSNGDGLYYGQIMAATTLKAFISPNEECADWDSGMDSFYNSGTPSLLSAGQMVLEKCEKTPTEFKYDYIVLIPTITGLVMMVVFVIMSINVAVRAFKLLALQIIAPLPIISYIDPKSSKGGMFDNWLKLSIKTYLSIFTELAMVYMVLAVLARAVNNLSIPGIGNALLHGYASIFLMIGSFVFMFQASKFINQALGIKNDEKNLLGKILGSIGAGIGGATLGVAGSIIAKGGISGAKAAALAGLSNGLTGGKATAGFRSGLDIGEQVRSGGENIKYKNFLQRGQENIMKQQAARRLGLKDADEVNRMYDDFKAKKIQAAADLDAAKTAYDNGKEFEYNGKTYSGQDLYDLIYAPKTGLMAVSGKAESKFTDFSSHIASFGLGSKTKTSMDKATEAMQFFNEEKYKASVTSNVSNNTNNNVNNNVSNNTTHSGTTLQQSGNVGGLLDRIGSSTGTQTTTINNHIVQQTSSGIITGGDVEGILRDISQGISTGNQQRRNANLSNNNGNNSNSDQKRGTIIGPDGRPLN